ncbi:MULTISPECIES: amino acid adenylation domain-containing protein [unclassified Pseudomonas]|uniref:amino acid adenylation domain-containing protein n=1 Tax=unclassified Pseudomonas TaxID=196821 RepID=UPI002AC9ECC2|nr:MULTISPECIES: amino acid adenylation domain-containing protein [unclassified Pseudomonas]MEB0048644.1 amino acid adenylation domain-containing protein [Pseudomonas sp. Dout3]MEB0097849.1 amino acid adenylation domain-containing protein [Pseudomonas sp. DC1.2]WPX57240.1 amino acid adenylation domain-containing protein [Pseudomonas sp. DC1.2]
MNAADAQKLARRFIELPQDKRHLFLAGMAREGIDFAQLPMTACVGTTERDGLSYAQQRMWFLWQLDPQSAAYNLPMAVRLNGALQPEALERAFSLLVARHECLRTTFGQEGEQAFQRVAEPSALTFAVSDLSALPQAQRWPCAQQHMVAEATQAFDLQHGPLLSLRLLRMAEQEHVLLLTLHHIIADGWSMNILIDEFMRTYDALVAGRQPTLPALAVHYRDYALWQRSWLEAGERERQLDYWRQQLGEAHPILELPTDRAYPAQSSHQGARLEKVIDASLRQGLKSLAQRHGVTLFVVLLAAFKTLLHRYSGQTDIRVGGLIANRTRSETEGLIGFFVNTQILRSEVTAQTRFADLLQSLRQAALGAQAHQELPFDALLEALQPARSQSHNPLFQVMFNHQPLVTDLHDVTLDCGLQVGYLSEEQLAGSGRQHAATSDLMLDTREEGEQLFAAFTYATDLFDESTIAALAGHWHNLLASVCRDPQQAVGALSMLAEDEREGLIQHTQASARMACVQQLFEAQVARTPAASALILATDQAPSLSYAELNIRSNRLAHHLRAHGVGPDVLVGVALGRSIELAVALLAVLKAGGAYVPLDPQTPAERLRHVLDDSGLKLLLTDRESLVSLPNLAGIDCLCVDRLPCDEATDNPQVAVDAQNLAYVIYTSGSTGRPKGVAVSHGALSEFIERAIDYSDLHEGDRVLQFATSSFDGFVEQFFPPLCHGACVVLRDTRLWDSATLHQVILEHGITLADLPAAYWHWLVQDYAANPPTHFGALRQIHVGGEAMAVEGLHLWQRAGLSHVRLLNTYGPTEATVVSTIHDCSALTPDAVSWRGIPIGHGLAQRRLYVLDDDLNVLPQGAVGELYIGGPGLARGYHQQPTLSAERFIADPFAVGERLYRTGDRTRWRTDGALEYVGRVDHQVKIRGFRIELGEIESRLQQCAGIREAVVLALTLTTGLQLVAYLVADDAVLDSVAEQAAFRQQVRASLQASLPDYMVPSHWLILPHLPLTPSGKLDRKALPAPDPRQLQADYRAPHTETERCLAQIWREVLQVPQAGLDDHFFELGGHSLLAAQVIARIKNQLGVSLPLRSLFEKPLLGDLALELAQLIGGAASNDWSDMDQFMSSLEGVDV